jgi:signal transduction histidine kinase
MSSVVSHQMLQQLGIIRLHADLIQHAETADPRGALAAVRQHAARIDEALEGVNRVLTDLLVFSRDLRLNLYEHPLDRVLAESVEECRAQANERGVGLRLECAPDVTLTIDKLKIRQAVVNVVRNAIDASPPGTEVGVAGRRDDGTVTITVRDHGPGVPEEQREAIFSPFFTTKETGTGLGLAIAREFVAAHGGHITAGRPSDGGGARFTIRLPKRPEEAAGGTTRMGS